MTYDEFLEQVITDGIRAATKDYSKPGDRLHREGSIAGFRACHGKTPPELKELLEVSSLATEDARKRNAVDYWWYRCYECEVEWVCNCVSAVLLNEGQEVIITPTARGTLKADQILRNLS